MPSINQNEGPEERKQYRKKGGKSTKGEKREIGKMKMEKFVF